MDTLCATFYEQNFRIVYEWQRTMKGRLQGLGSRMLSSVGQSLVRWRRPNWSCQTFDKCQGVREVDTLAFPTNKESELDKLRLTVMYLKQMAH